MLGIPTCSDVRDAEYQKALYIQKLKDKLSGFGWPTNDLFLHNHVNNALHHIADPFVRGLTEKLYKGESDEKEEKIEPLLNPEYVLRDYIDRIDAFREALEEAKPYIDKFGVHLKTTKPVDRGERLSSLIRVEECVEDWMQESSRFEKPKKWWQFSRKNKDVVVGRQYFYNPYELAKTELNNFKAELLEAFSPNSHSSKLVRIRAMYKVIKKYDGSPNKEFIENLDSMLMYITDWPMTWEHNKTESEAYKLYQEHKKIAAISDLYIRFDEWCWCIENYMIPPSDKILKEPLFEAVKLSRRTLLRDKIAGLKGSKYGVVIHGITYITIYSGDDLVGYEVQTDGPHKEIPREIVNLLGVPVEIKNNGILISSIYPDKWAIEEIALVKQYREAPLQDLVNKHKECLSNKVYEKMNIPHPPVVSNILSHYTDFGKEDGMETEQEKAYHLLYTLREYDARSLHWV